MNDKPFATTELNPLPDSVQELIAERDEWKSRCEFSFKQRDDISERYQTASRLAALSLEALSKALKERDALKDAARLALEAFEVATTPLAKDRQEILKAIAALKAVL